MAEEPTTPESTEPSEPAPEPSGDTPSGDQPVQLPDDHPLVKSLNQWKSEAKDLRSKVKEFEDSQKTDEQRQQERLSELESTAKKSTLEAARLRVALRKGLNEAQAKRLVGDSEEDLEADADELLATFAPAEEGETPSASRRPQERLRPGATPSSEPEKSPDEIAESILSKHRI